MVAQIALAVVLVAASGLMTRSFLRLNAVRPGFDADHVVTSSVLLPFARYGPASRLNFFDALVREANKIPGVEDVGLTNWVPLSGDRRDLTMEVEAMEVEANSSQVNQAVPRRCLFQGAARCSAADVRRGAARPREVIVTQAFAEQYLSQAPAHWAARSSCRRRVAHSGR